MTPRTARIKIATPALEMGERATMRGKTTMTEMDHEEKEDGREEEEEGEEEEEEVEEMIEVETGRETTGGKRM